MIIQIIAPSVDISISSIFVLTVASQIKYFTHKMCYKTGFIGEDEIIVFLFMKTNALFFF